MSEKLSAIVLARKIMVRHRWDREKAIDEAMTLSQTDKGLMQEVLHTGWENIIGHVASMRRDQLMQGGRVAPVASRADNPTPLRSVMSRSFLELYDVLGIPLGKCTPDDLRRSISSRKSTVATHQQRINFESAVLKKCKPNKTVGQCWNDSDLEDLAQSHNVRRAA
jgi:hypothetical protein